ncbi:gas vesicle protein [Terribacillus saccharophilus]|uniref:Gas vesicle protein GvpS n=1 Tax=Terribacillus saccharophilus TaxID=361277 RepID=A0A268AF06_9BACI|nr:gas vesicle protein [Terribacillus saccharophilus]PAD22701.1 gas vesicle protein GvpS [Terribacillus saccharophilus]PAF18173.1 gas vesicle protein GvpS [Terribacillus saccharophilus]PAF23603.1 gas vesicle protein GvpS [Terribacillus saccharophilus]PAF37285.1 gas vesicle protein GvpS [Terribacillus saccharophilus]PAF39885.1 gas vesicle protein GvpS [Terribacillus saccharophilus]
MNTRETIDRNKDVSLIDILDVILDKGVALKGDLIISIAGVDLVYLDLRVLIASVETLVQNQSGKSRMDITSEAFDKQKEELEYGSAAAEERANPFRS